MSSAHMTMTAVGPVRTARCSLSRVRLGVHMKPILPLNCLCLAEKVIRFLRVAFRSCSISTSFTKPIVFKAAGVHRHCSFVPLRIDFQVQWNTYSLTQKSPLSVDILGLSIPSPRTAMLSPDHLIVWRQHHFIGRYVWHYALSTSKPHLLGLSIRFHQQANLCSIS
jgi:hypothetical protein